MGLIACPDCQSSVSDQAQACPVCGAPVAARLQQLWEEKRARRAKQAARKKRRTARRIHIYFALTTVGALLIGAIALYFASR